MQRKKTADPVTILLAYRDGAKWLEMQLESIRDQTHQNWRLIASDDGSHDQSSEIVAAFAKTVGKDRVEMIQGPQKGSSTNFRHLLHHSQSDEGAVAFCDQDDVWIADHLTRGLRFLAASPNQNAIFGARMTYTNAALQPIGLSPLPQRRLGFRNALVQNVLSGNTMLLSAKAAKLLRAASFEAPSVALHDWWAYQIISGAGGQVFYDEKPHLLYRQHGQNLVGSNSGPGSLKRKAQRYLGGNYRIQSLADLRALKASQHRFTDMNRQILSHFIKAMEGDWLDRQVETLRAGIYFQTRKSQTAFFACSALGRL